MWVMTHFGILMPGLRPVRGPDDDRELQIRARRRQDLDYLRAYFMSELGETVTLGKTDYQYRAYCTREQWGDALKLIALEMDYVKFKETAETKHNDKKLHDVYVKIWSVIYRAFPTGAYGEWNRGRQRGTTQRKNWWEDAVEHNALVRDQYPQHYDRENHDEPVFTIVDENTSIDDALEIDRVNRKRSRKRGRK